MHDEVTARLQQSIEALYGLERRRDKLGLDGTKALLRVLGNPERRFRSVHVAGTNGKGSVCALVERVLREAGFRTGLFTSPHLVDFRERIRVCGRWADEERLARRLEFLQSLPEGQDRTFFEIATALGFDDFAAENVEWAVVEVGLGGRLDTTNVLEPEISVITSIDWDHMEILGDSLQKIAAEKAGIIKPGVPVVENAAFTSTRDVIRGIAEARAAPLTHAGDAVALQVNARTGAVVCTTRAWGDLHFAAGELGALHHLNLGTALATLEVLAARGLRVPREAVLEGSMRARWPGRLERCPGEPRLWWDGAHNTHGVEALHRVWHLTGAERPGAIVLALSRDKPVDRILALLDLLWPGVRLVATRSRNERAMPAERIAAVAAHGLQGEEEGEWRGGWSAEVAPDVPSACRLAVETATTGRPALLTGSLFAIGEAMEAFGGAPGEWQ